MSVQPFTITIAQRYKRRRMLDDVHERLARTRWPDEVDEADWTTAQT